MISKKAAVCKSEAACAGFGLLVVCDDDGYEGVVGVAVEGIESRCTVFLR